MKIITISEPDCGAKPTGYAAQIPNDNRETLREHIERGLVEGWFMSEEMAKKAASEEDLDDLRASWYTYLCGGRFLVEVTILEE